MRRESNPSSPALRWSSTLWRIDVEPRYPFVQIPADLVELETGLSSAQPSHRPQKVAVAES